MTFQEKLDTAVQKNNSLFCIGLDLLDEKIPQQFKNEQNPFFAFNKSIIDATHDLVCAYKPNSAFYEAKGKWGIEQLKMTCDYIASKNIPIILDAKRGDIDSTNEAYAQYAFDYLGADAMTLHSYLGGGTLEPFLKRAHKGFFILCRTSNKGADEFQDLIIDGEPLYLKVARNFSTKWNKSNNCMLVVGATFPEELAKVRKIVGNMTILIPGIGTQGGSIEESLKAGLNSEKKGIIITASRSVIYTDNPRAEAQKLRDEINKCRS